MKFVVTPNFITRQDVDIIKSFQKPPTTEILNYHIKSVNDGVKGWSVMYDFNKTAVSQEVTKFQGDGTMIDELPAYYEQLGHRIAETVGVSSENMFFQYILIGSGGQVGKHYDAGKPGYVTYKCNICVEGPAEDLIHVDKGTLPVTPLGLYCFEANLYKHWMETHDAPRIHLSYGYIVPYADLGWSSDAPRVRLSNRIWNAYIQQLPQ